ncbi:50S ribosomal protein L29 [Candidatus Gottesmanbacteria bacterium]|nr:50S ribosomal protein L29 [Candidatus Gottesmanbacteria bacterium]
MKKNQIAQLRLKSAEELKAMLSQGRNEIKKLLVEVKARKLKNTASVGQKKKDIAQILTFIREKELVSS